MDLLTPAKPGEDVVVHKPTANISLGLTFVDPDDDDRLKTPEGTTLCIIKHVRPESISETFLRPGDRIVSIENKLCSDPATAAKHLRSLEGDFHVEVMRDYPLDRKDAQQASAEEEAVDVSEQSGEENKGLRRIQSPPKFEDHESKSAQELREGSTLTSAKSSSAYGMPQPTGNRHAPTPSSPAASAPFHLNLPGSIDQMSDPRIFGNKAHLRLGGAGSAKDLLKSQGSPSVRPLSARFRQLSSMLTPRGSHA